MLASLILAFGVHANPPLVPEVPAARFGRSITEVLRRARDADSRADGAELDRTIDALVLLNRWVHRCEFERARCHQRATGVVEAHLRRAVRDLGPLNEEAATRVASALEALSERTRRPEFYHRALGPARTRRRRRERQLTTEACLQAGTLSFVVDAIVGATAFGCDCHGVDLSLALVTGNFITAVITWLGQLDERDVLKLDDTPDLIGALTFSCVGALIE